MATDENAAARTLTDAATQGAQAKQRTQVEDFAAKYQLASNARAELEDLIDGAVRERVEAESDLRIGRVLGSTLAAL